MLLQRTKLKSQSYSGQYGILVLKKIAEKLWSNKTVITMNYFETKCEKLN